MHEPAAQRALGALLKLTESSCAATERIEAVVRSLKLFARLDESEVKVVDPHEGLESALLLLGPELPLGEEPGEVAGVGVQAVRPGLDDVVDRHVEEVAVVGDHHEGPRGAP